MTIMSPRITCICAYFLSTDYLFDIRTEGTKVFFINVITQKIPRDSCDTWRQVGSPQGTVKSVKSVESVDRK